MARPTRAQEIELERLERACGLVSRARETVEIVEIRLHQVLRRAPALYELAMAGLGQIAAIARALDEAHGLIAVVLEQRGEERHEAHFGAQKARLGDGRN